MKTHTSMNTNLVGQDMALRAMKSPKSYVGKQLEIWRKRRDIIYKELKDMGLDLWKPEGAFYVLPEVPQPEKLATMLYTDYKVIVYLGSWFGAPRRVRLSYALDEKEMKEGLNRIKDCLGKL
jgi:aspartate/methionine/tyrosine aminotransferase